ncbi:MAG: menaquinone biosynthesis protein [Armatimonadetes bacterium]|nr:menaquinone biosynthesis protein [Armatimonadota bacterium]
MTYRVGTVQYLNAKPLTWALEQGWIEGVEVVSDVPSALAARLLAGELDAAMLSSIVALREPLMQVIPEAGCIAADGPVQSVLLFTKVHVEQIARVALDVSSLTAAGLTRVLLEQRYRLRPEYITMPPDLGAMLAEADAALLIGDPGLAHYVADQPAGLYDVLDLGREWHEWTGYPFVFAAWIARNRHDDPGLAAVLRRSREMSCAAIADIARDAAARLGLGEMVCRHYLERVIRYQFGERERKGYELFGAYLRREERG